MLYPQNGDRIVAIDSVTSLHPIYDSVVPDMRQTDRQTDTLVALLLSPAKGGAMRRLVFLCLQAGVLHNTLESVVRAVQLVRFVKATLNDTKHQQIKIRRITRQLDRLLRDVEEAPDVGFYPLICHIHSLIGLPDHQYCPSKFALSQFTCSDEIDLARERDRRRLSHALLTTMRDVVLASMQRALTARILTTVRHHHRLSRRPTPPTSAPTARLPPGTRTEHH